MILGLLGNAGSGKDTVAKMLIDKGWLRMAFGDKLKQCLYALDPRVEFGPGQTGHLRDLVDAHGWDYCKAIPEVRSLLQRFGTEVGRNTLSQGIWINAILEKLVSSRKTHNIVVTDVRFANEAQALTMLGGRLVRVVRQKSVQPDAQWRQHISEKEANAIRTDYIVDNNGDLDHLTVEVDRVLGTMQELLISNG